MEVYIPEADLTIDFPDDTPEQEISNVIESQILRSGQDKPSFINDVVLQTGKDVLRLPGQAARGVSEGVSSMLDAGAAGRQIIKSIESEKSVKRI